MRPLFQSINFQRRLYFPFNTCLEVRTHIEPKKIDNPCLHMCRVPKYILNLYVYLIYIMLFGWQCEPSGHRVSGRGCLVQEYKQFTLLKNNKRLESSLEYKLSW